MVFYSAIEIKTRSKCLAWPTTLHDFSDPVLVPHHPSSAHYSPTSLRTCTQDLSCPLLALHCPLYLEQSFFHFGHSRLPSFLRSILNMSSRKYWVIANKVIIHPSFDLCQLRSFKGQNLFKKCVYLSYPCHVSLKSPVVPSKWRNARVRSNFSISDFNPKLFEMCSMNQKWQLVWAGVILVPYDDERTDKQTQYF